MDELQNGAPAPTDVVGRDKLTKAIKDETQAVKLADNAAIDLSIEREKLVTSIDNENTATKLADQAATELAEARERLIAELGKQSPVIDYNVALNAAQAALLSSIQDKTTANHKLADATTEQVKITKRTATKGSADVTKGKESSVMGKLLNKAFSGVGDLITDKLSATFDDMPLVKEAKQAATFTKSVMPDKKKEKRIQSKKEKEKKQLPAPVAPEKKQTDLERYKGMLKERDEVGSGKVARQSLVHLESIDKKLTNKFDFGKFAMGAIALFKLIGMFGGLIFKAMKMLFTISRTLAAITAAIKLIKELAGFKRPKIEAGKPNKSGKPDPKKTDKPGEKKDPKKTDKPGEKKDPKKTDKPDAKKPESGKPNDIKPDAKPDPKKPEAGKPNDIKPDKPNGKANGKITKGNKFVEGLKNGAKAAKNGAKVGAKGIPFLGTLLFAADVVHQQSNDPRNTGLSHAQAIMNGDQDNYSGDYDPSKMERGAADPTQEIVKLSEAEQKERAEAKKEDRAIKALMAQSVNQNNTTINNINNSQTTQSESSEIRPFANEYQTSTQRGSMIQR